MNEDDRVRVVDVLDLRTGEVIGQVVRTGDPADIPIPPGSDEWCVLSDGRDLRTGEVVQIQGSVRVIDEPHREAIKAQVRRAVLLDPRWPRQSIASLKQPAERQVNARYRAMLERVAGQLAAKRRAR